jgi:heme exporter protein D
MECDPQLIACQLSQLVDLMTQSWWEHLLVVYVWPLVAVLVPVAIAISVSIHTKRTTLKSVAEQIRVQQDLVRNQIDAQQKLVSDQIAEERRRERMRLRRASIAQLIQAVSEVAIRPILSGRELLVHTVGEAARIVTASVEAQGVLLEADEDRRGWIIALGAEHNRLLPGIGEGRSRDQHSQWCTETIYALTAMLDRPITNAEFNELVRNSAQGNEPLTPLAPE